MLFRSPYPAQETLNTASLIYNLSNIELDLYEPDRVYFPPNFSDSTTHPELYDTGVLTTAVGSPVYVCDVSGNYIDASTTITTTDFQTTRKLKYKLIYDWFMEEYYIPGVSSENPYWQYLVIKDEIDSSSDSWVQTAKIFKKIKRNTGAYIYEQLADSAKYFLLRAGLEYKTSAEAFEVVPVDYIDHKAGKIYMTLLANPEYDKTVNPALDTQLQQYGIPLTSHFKDTPYEDIFSEDFVIQHPAMISSITTATYTVNSRKNFANPYDQAAAIVGITELGVFNAADELIVYATFPPIIYDSSKHHASFNIFIKEGSF